MLAEIIVLIFVYGKSTLLGSNLADQHRNDLCAD